MKFLGVIESVEKDFKQEGDFDRWVTCLQWPEEVMREGGPSLWPTHQWVWTHSPVGLDPLTNGSTGMGPFSWTHSPVGLDPLTSGFGPTHQWVEPTHQWVGGLGSLRLDPLTSGFGPTRQWVEASPTCLQWSHCLNFKELVRVTLNIFRKIRSQLLKNLNFLGIGYRDSKYFGKIRCPLLKNLNFLGFGIRDSKYFRKIRRPLLKNLNFLGIGRCDTKYFLEKLGVHSIKT